MADDGAVLGSDVVQVIGREIAAGAHHVLDHDVGIAGDVPPEMLNQELRIGAVRAAGFAGADQRDGLVLVEVGDRIGARGRARQAG